MAVVAGSFSFSSGVLVSAGCFLTGFRSVTEKWGCRLRNSDGLVLAAAGVVDTFRLSFFFLLFDVIQGFAFSIECGCRYLVIPEDSPYLVVEDVGVVRQILVVPALLDKYLVYQSWGSIGCLMLAVSVVCRS